MNISHVLSELMFEKKIKMIALAHQTGVPQSTLSRILSGDTTNPHRSSLEPLATFFEISIDQLLGREPIASLQRLSSKTASVPLLTWDQVPFWLTSTSQVMATEFTPVDLDLSEGSFAVTVADAAMEPQFPHGAVLIVDAQKPPKDRSFVVATLGGSLKVVFRQLLTDGLNRYLRPLSPDFSQFGMIPMADNDQILGVVLQTRKNYA